MRNRRAVSYLHGYAGYHPFAPGPLPRGRKFVIAEWERGVLFQDGRLVTVLGPGAHRRWGARCTLRRVDVRPSVLAVPGQEIPTADGLTVKVTVVAQVRVTDPAAFVTASQDTDALVYLYLQIVTREVVAVTSLEDILTGRARLGDALTEAAVSRTAGEVGLGVDRVELKDVVLPSELKKAQAEVLVARAQGQAALERARGETAALRNLANAAGLLQANPALLQLRLVQQLAATSGHTVVIGQAPLGA